MRTMILALAALLGAQLSAAADPIIQIPSRGQSIRAVLLKPSTTPKGAVILLAGGDGRLDITAAGVITKLTANQLVRTRAMYRAKGYLTLVPDLAPDMKVGTGVLSGYRKSPAYAQDVGAMVTVLRKQLAGKPVTVIGTSRGSGGAANAVSKLIGTSKRPNFQVLTSALLKLNCTDPINVWCITGGNPNLLRVPTYVVWHVADACTSTPPSAVPAFEQWYEKNKLTLSLKSFSGGAPPQSGPCDAKSPHGFWGLDGQVVNSITAWIAKRTLAFPDDAVADDEL
jgi:hypothetical protein